MNIDVAEESEEIMDSCVEQHNYGCVQNGYEIIDVRVPVSGGATSWQ